jgi:hypothetical protein
VDAQQLAVRIEVSRRIGILCLHLPLRGGRCRRAALLRTAGQQRAGAQSDHQTTMESGIHQQRTDRKQGL